MALTSAQEQYLKGLGIGKGAGRGGALSGAGKGAATGAAFGPIGAGVGAVVGGLAGWLGGRGKAKKAQAEARAKLEQANAAFNQSEDTRLARVGAGQSLLSGLTGRGFTNIDPATAAKLLERRELDPALAGLYNESAGAGSAGAADALGTLIDFGAQYGIEQDRMGMSSGQAGVPMQETPGVPDLRSRVGEFDTGIDYTLDPYGPKRHTGL